MATPPCKKRRPALEVLKMVPTNKMSALVLGFAIPFVTLTVSTPAMAGGIGIMGQGGTHTEKVYYYSDHDTSVAGEPVPYRDLDDYDQYNVVQNLLHTGFGVELILGDRGDRIMGVFRGYALNDAAQADPAEGSAIPTEYIVKSYREESRLTGVALMGLSWGIFGQPDNLQAGLGARMGSGFLTKDHTEYLITEIGPMGTYKLSRQLQAHADVAYQMRYRKGFSHGWSATGGVRWLFD